MAASEEGAVTIVATQTTVGWPAVSVVVPTYNRAASLADTLAGLLAQDYPSDRLEVMVVDDASTDETAAVVRAAQVRAPFPVRYLRQERRGPAAARNAGVAHATGEIIGFTDSDCHVPPSWVRQAVRRMEPEVGLVAGPIRAVVHEQRRPGFFRHQIDEVQGESPTYPTANVFYRREALARVGGFNESFGAFPWGPPAYGEDTELAWRVKRAGYRSAFAREALVEHEASGMSARSWLVDPVRVQHLPFLVGKVPELREYYLWCRYFLGWGNPVFLLAVAGLVLGTRKSPGFLLLALPWLWITRGPIMGDRWPPARWWRIPLKYALQAERFGLVTATLIYGSLRHRVLVL